MNRFFQKKIFIVNWILILFLISSFITPIYSVDAKTIINNSVQITADSSGESHASVTTIINGKVVENWSVTSTEPIVYSKSISSTGTTTNISIEHQQMTNQDQLKAMIKQLQALISLYVSLLKK